MLHLEGVDSLEKPQMKLSMENYEIIVLRSSKRFYFTYLNTCDKNGFGRLSKLLLKESLIPSLVHDDTEANSDKEKAEILSAKAGILLSHLKISTSVNWGLYIP